MDKDLESQRKALAELRQKFENESNPNQQQWTEDEIMRLLRSLPLAYFNQGNVLVEAMITMKVAKQKLKTVYSKKLLEANYDPDLKAANERKAWAETHKDYLEAESELIIAEGKYRAAELHLQAYDNLYTAVKKASSIVSAQNQGQARFN